MSSNDLASRNDNAKPARMAISGHGKSRNKGGSSSMHKLDHMDMECWKCGQAGHVRKNCHSKRKKKEGGESGKGKDITNTATGGEEFAFTTTFAGVMLTCTSNPLSRVETDIYDSDASSHMSPMRDWFTTFMAIAPKPIKAADQMLFIATAMGKLWVCIPNGNTTMAVTLKNVLYCPNLTFTLISLM